jgi:hypothetical protein
LTEEAHQQPYDNVIKRLFERHALEILPYLLQEKNLARDEDRQAFKLKDRSLEHDLHEGEELNIEALIPARRNDRVYRIPYEEQMHVVGAEIETSPGGILPVRLLIYHSLHVEKYYGQPIISMILFPFKTAIPRSPLQTTNGDGESVTFHFRVLPLWRMDARRYLEQRIISMFAFLPTMGGATRDMLFQALELMVQFYRGQHDEAGLHEEMLAFGVLLGRTDILSSDDVKEVTRKMIYHDPLIEEDPYFGGIIKERAEEKAEERAKEVRAETFAAWKSALLRAIEARFPDLAATIGNVVLPDNSEALAALMVNVAIAPNEETVRLLLGIQVH